VTSVTHPILLLTTPFPFNHHQSVHFWKIPTDLGDAKKLTLFEKEPMAITLHRIIGKSKLEIINSYIDKNNVPLAGPGDRPMKWKPGNGGCGHAAREGQARRERRGPRDGDAGADAAAQPDQNSAAAGRRYRSWSTGKRKTEESLVYSLIMEL